MGRKREPEAIVGAEDYRIVKHTHDEELARKLMLAALIEEYGPLAEGADGAPKPSDLGPARLVYVRQIHALDSSFAAAEGWSSSFHEYATPGRGAFPAVVFRV